MTKTISVLFTLLTCLSATGMKCISDGAEATEGSGTFSAGVGGATMSLGVGWKSSRTGGGRALTVVNPTTGTHEGCIVFKDAQGNTISTTPAQIPPGGSMTVPIPANAVKHHIANGDDCPDRNAPAGGAAAAISAASGASRFRYGATDVVSLADPNVDYWIWGRADAAGAWTQTADYLSNNGYRHAFLAQNGVSEVEAFLTEFAVMPGNDIEVTLATNGTLESLELWLNGSFVQDMAQAYRPSIVGTGWDAYSFLLPASMPGLNYSPVTGDSWSNDVVFRFSRLGDPTKYRLQRSAGFTSI